MLLLMFLFICASCNNRFINYPFIAHSHNDYEQEIPIKTALDLGFTSLEVDIVYHEGSIVVSHDFEDLALKPDFEKDYLIPFLSQVAKDRKYILLVDVKNYSFDLIEDLNAIFSKYKLQLISRYTSKEVSSGVQIVLSGDFPRDRIIKEERNQYLFVDGRLEYLSNVDFDAYTPLVSMNLRHVTQWRGDREPNEGELTAIRNVVDKVHQSGKLLRFWNAPDTEIMWRTLEDLRVDIIGVDDLQRFYDVNFHKWNN